MSKLTITILSLIDSPRIYVSTNPWKITATFETVSSTREEYLDIIENLKNSAPPESKKTGRRTKLENAHLSLIAALEARIETIDAEIAVSKKRFADLNYHCSVCLFLSLCLSISISRRTARSESQEEN